MEQATLNQISTATGFRFTVNVPSSKRLTDGTFLVRLIFGNRKTGAVSRIVYGLFGKQAVIGGDRLTYGTTGVAFDANHLRQKEVIPVRAEARSLRIDVPQAVAKGATLIFAEVYGTTDAFRMGAGEVSDWHSFPSKILLSRLTSGSYILPAIPGSPTRRQ